MLARLLGGKKKTGEVNFTMKQAMRVSITSVGGDSFLHSCLYMHSCRLYLKQDTERTQSSSYCRFFAWYFFRCQLAEFFILKQAMLHQLMPERSLITFAFTSEK